MDDDAWFEPKRFGYGTELPIAWQGWVLTTATIAAVAAAALLHERRVMAAVELAILVPSLILCARHTRGGWRWRWGRDPE